MCHVVGVNNGHGQACHWEQVCIPSYNDIAAYKNVAIAGVDTIAGFEIHRPRVWMIWTSPSTLFCWLLSERWPSSCILLRGREDTGTRNERKSLWREWSHCVKIIQGGAGLCLNEVFGINY